MTTVARAERAALADALDAVGPDAPTLCEGWAARDLAAHLMLRERRPDAAPGIAVARLAGYTARVQASLAAKPWPRLVDLVRSGPPRLSPLRIPRLDDAFNSTEFFIHCEDVRRAQPGWEPRAHDPRLEDALWGTLRLQGRALFKRSPVGVLLRRDPGDELRPRAGEPAVTLTGPASELALYAFGRKGQARVRVDGDPAAVAGVAAAPLGI